MYLDHRTVTALQNQRVAELRRLAERRRAIEALDTTPTAAPSGRWRAALARLRPRQA